MSERLLAVRARGSFARMAILAILAVAVALPLGRQLPSAYAGPEGRAFLLRDPVVRRAPAARAVVYHGKLGAWIHGVVPPALKHLERIRR